MEGKIKDNKEMNARKIQEEIEKNWYWDARVEELEALHYFDDVILKWLDENDIVTIQFEGCCDVHFQQDLNYGKEKAIKDCKKNEIPYYMQDVNVRSVEKEERAYCEVEMNIWPMSLRILCRNVRVLRKSKKE